MGEDKDEEGDGDDDALCASQVASESLNRSSSFLFDSLYDTSLLAGLSPHEDPDQAEEAEADSQEVGDNRHLHSTQERRRSELLANQEVENQEAIQWGESSFNLSEWGDSLLVGEHFLERRSLLRHTERMQKEQDPSHGEAQQPSTSHVLTEQQVSNLQTTPGKTEPPKPNRIITQKHYHKDKANNNQDHTNKAEQCIEAPNSNKSVNLNSEEGGKSKGREDEREVKINEEGKNRQEVEKGRREEREMKEERNVPLSNTAVLKHPVIQNTPENCLNCSPGLQDIFDRWPSMSDQSSQFISSGFTDTYAHAAAGNKADVPEIPQSSMQVDRKRPGLNLQSASVESKSREKQPTRQETVEDTRRESGGERPGSATDLIPPTQQTTPITPRVKLTTSSVQSPLNAQLLNQSSSSREPGQPPVPKCPKSCPEPSNHFTSAPSKAISDSKQMKSTSNLNHKHQLEQEPKAVPASEAHAQIKPLPHAGSNPSLPRDFAPPLSPRSKPRDLNSALTDENITSQLSQNASLSSSNSGTFSIIDVASDRHLFHTFINEWKTKERYALALACERREHAQQLEGGIGEKHKRGK